jgi:hypothetical protein
VSDWSSSTTVEAWRHQETQVLSSPAASITFSGIAAANSYRLNLFVYIVKDGTGGTLDLRINNNSGNNYRMAHIHGTSTTVAGARDASSVAQMRSARTIAASSTAIAWYTILKGQSGSSAPGPFSETLVSLLLGLVASGGIEVEHAEGFWAAQFDLTNRVDILTSAGNFAAGTRAVLEGKL